MKTIKIEVYNGKNVLTQTFRIHQSTGLNKITGTAINKIFQFNERLRKYNSDGFIKASDNLGLVISTDETVLIDSMELNSQYGFRLRFGQNAKSKRKFAACLSDLITWASEETQIITLDELIDSLES